MELTPVSMGMDICIEIEEIGPAFIPSCQITPPLLANATDCPLGFEQPSFYNTDRLFVIFLFLFKDKYTNTLFDY